MNSKLFKTIQSSIFIVMISMSFSTFSKPTYESKESKEVIKKMIKAHGGYKKWKSIPAIRFDNIMHNNYHSKNEFAWWVSHEVIDQKSRKVYQDWPLNNAEIAYDGEQVWSTNWKKANPPSAMVHFFYYFINLPWLTQDDGVILSDVSDFEWPGTGKSYHQIKMSYEKAPSVGKGDLDYFILYIDKDTYLLQGYQYAISNRAFLKALGQPEERKIFGPLWRMITQYTTVEGLTFPAAFRTMPEANERIVGNHVILNIDVTTEFDHSKLQKPDAAVIDQSQSMMK